MVTVVELITVLVLFIVVAVVGYFFYRSKKSYKMKAVIFEQRADGQNVPRLDMCRRIRDKEGEYYLQLKSNKKKIKPIDFDFLHVGNFLVLYTPDGITYYAAKMIRDSTIKVKISDPTQSDPKATKEVEIPAFRATPDDIRFWEELEIKKALYRTDLTKTLERLAPLIGVAILLLMAGIMMYIVAQGMADVAEQLGGVSGGLAQVSNDLIEAIKILKTGSVPPTQGIPAVTTPPF